MEKTFVERVQDAGIDLQGMMQKEDSMILLATSDNCGSFVRGIQGNGKQLVDLLHYTAKEVEVFKDVLLAVAEIIRNEQNK